MLNAEERALLLAARKYKLTKYQAEAGRRAWDAVKNKDAKSLEPGCKVAAYKDYEKRTCAATNALERLMEAVDALD